MTNANSTSCTLAFREGEAEVEVNACRMEVN